MKNIQIVLIAIFFSLINNSYSQSKFNYTFQLNPVNISNLPGLHSYVFGQDNGKWLIIGGRLDGLHARQPFNAFQPNQNNDSIYVVDVNNNQYWSASLSTLAVGIREQLQSTNMNFFQDKDSLYIIGGYAYANSASNHITFPNLTSVIVSGLINAIVNNQSITPYFKQISNPNFAITGGQLGKIGNDFYLVGGQKFDGRYNPMGNPTYTQSYSNQIRKFQINNSGTSLSISNYSAATDAVHLHRRDYNLIPQIFPDRSEGYTISSGVFQTTADLPFLYPVDITASGHYPITSFNQYLSNYHSASASLYDSSNNEMHSIFFGGMSQYYYQNNTLIQDNLVPFVKTISRVTRFSDSSLQEFQLPVSMPNFQGASAEFIPNHNIAHYDSEIIKLDSINTDTTIIGHVYGGILSNSLNPFSVNQTTSTSADPTIFEVLLIRTTVSNVEEIDGDNPYELSLYPNPTQNNFTAEFDLDKKLETHYFISNELGQIIQEGELKVKAGKNIIPFQLKDSSTTEHLNFTLVIDNKYFTSKKIVHLK